MKRKRLSDGEIRKTVEKIRELYSDYMVRFQKSKHALDAFEDRYIDALRARLDLAHFLHAERGVIQELIANEEERIKEEEARKKSAEIEKEKQKSVAERMVAAHQRRIEKYPRLHVHEDASQEVERLFGAMGSFEREYWQDLESMIRKTYTSLMTSPRRRLEERLLQLCASGRSQVPPRLSRYSSLFDWFPRKWGEIEKEGNKCILDAAFFLHDIHDTLSDMKKSPDLSPGERGLLEKMATYVHTVIEDFRLKEFHKQSR